MIHILLLLLLPTLLDFYSCCKHMQGAKLDAHHAFSCMSKCGKWNLNDVADM